MLDLDNFKFFNDFYGHATGDEVLQKVARKLQSISRRYDTIARFGGDEFAVLLPGIQESDAAIIETRLRKSLRGLFYYVAEQNVTIPISVSLGAAIFTQNDTNCRQVLQRADDRLRWSKTGGELEDAAHHIRADAKNRVQGFSMLDALVAAVDNKDRYTRRHSEDVMEYSLMIYHEMGMDKQAQQTVAIAALLHDVGKIGVPDAILRKPGRLSTEEYEAVKQHPQMGAVMAGAVPGLEETLDAIRHHHERWDGGGYPLGLNGEDIPFIARAMAVADAFSAMTTDRPYRKGMDKRKALEILIAGAGTQWDPKCVTTFINAWSRRHPKARAA
jgi:diguanylate cyclase (GGDEF)-like protein